MSSQDVSLLFVYGTLMSSAGGALGRSQRARLAREGRSLGAAAMHGRLYDLGRYPGLVLSDAAWDVVHGEVVALTEAEKSLRWLDAYEQIVPGRHPHNQYERLVCKATLAGGEDVQAWVYVYRQSPTGKPLIPDGRWSAQSG